MSERLKLFIVDGNSEYIDTLEDFFTNKQAYGIDVIGKATTKNKFFFNSEAITKADVFVISASLPDGTGIELVEYIKANSSIRRKPILFTIDKQSRNYAAVASEKKVYKIFQKPFSIKDFITTLNQIREERKVDVLNNENSTTHAIVNESQENENPLEKTYEEIEKDFFKDIDTSYLLDLSAKDKDNEKQLDLSNGIYTFVSPGSTGKSSVIINVAYALRTLPKKKPSVCIVDLNLLYPSISYLFNQDEISKVKRDIYDISADLAYMNEELIAEALIKHGPTGIYILNTPPDKDSIHKIPSIKAEHLEKILLQLKSMFDIVLVDTKNDITDISSIVPVEFSEKVYVMIEPYYMNVVGASKIFYLLKKLEESIKEDVINKTHLVLNKESKQKSLDGDTVKRFLDNKSFLVRIPEDKDFITFINKGKFVIGSESITSGPITDLAKDIYPFDNVVPKKGKKLSKLPTLFPKKK